MLSNLQSLLDKALWHFKNELSKIQAWRANPSILEWIQVIAYWQSWPIKNIASISIVDNQTLKIEPWDKWLMWDIDKAISQANLWLNPQNMWEYIMIKIPLLTEDRRKELSKFVQWQSEDAKIAVRNIRQDFHKKITKANSDKDITDDETKQYNNELQDLVKKANNTIEELVKNKQEEIMKI